ncbi:pali-domain-containing protein [Mycena amicta]|nr:pali-domain-containing protein [Mycena amicta]
MFPSALFTLALLLIAFILLLLVTLSVPIIKTIYLFKLTAAASSGFFDSSASTSVVFGVWGYCTSGVDVSIVGVDHDTAGQCSKRHLGYTFDSTVANALHVSGFENLISKSLTAVLALHPVVVCLTFIAFTVSLLMLRRDGTSRLASLLAFIFGALAAILTTIVFLIDVILVAVVRHKVHKDTDGVLTLTWGNATWITLAATILLWISCHSLADWSLLWQ